MPEGGTRTSLVDPQGRPLTLPGMALGPAVSAANFSPGQPIDPVRPEPIRTWDFPVGVNTVITPRSTEPFGFSQLRAFANVELVRMAIETRKDQLDRLNWQIKPRGDLGRKKKTPDDPRVGRLTEFWRKPGYAGGKRASFATWLRHTVEDMLVLDAPAFEKRRDRGGALTGLDIVPGDTVKVLVDDTGRLPVAPYPAYQQIIKGRVWADLTTDDLLYAPRNQRPNHIYGYGPVEQIVVTIHTIINRQASQLAYFTEGTTPAGFLQAPETWTMEQLKQLQVWLDAKLSGNLAERRKVIVVPGGGKHDPLKDPPLKDEFDEWLARVVAFAFSLPPTPFIRQMNRGTAAADADRSMEEGLEPLKLWVKRLIDGVNEDEFGVTDLEFSWMDTPEIDPAKQAEIDNLNLRNGSSTIDEVRDARGDDPLPDGQGGQPLLYTSTGAMTLEQVLKAAEEAINPVETAPPLPAGQAPPPGEAQPAAAPPPAKKLSKAAAAHITADRPKARRHTAALRKAIAPILTKCGDEVSADVGMQLRGFHKAADDTGPLTNAELAKRIADAVSLDALDDLSAAALDDLQAVALDSGNLAVVSVGASTDDLTDQVFQRAADFARQRAAELVSLQGPDNIVQPTRDMIRTVIADGLDQNIGSDAIADAVQASTAFSADRAELIAKTEIANANGQGKLAGWQIAADTGLKLQKTWLVVTACCDDCALNAAASPIPLGDTFPSGDAAEPGHPRCRCSTVCEEIPADETGE